MADAETSQRDGRLQGAFRDHGKCQKLKGQGMRPVEPVPFSASEFEFNGGKTRAHGSAVFCPA
jgi:hypothetical protein